MYRVGMPLACFLAAVVYASFAHADVLNVPSAEYATVQSAIDAADDGDEIVVAPGTYSESINFSGKAITVRSSDGPEVTTLDATGANDAVVTFELGEGSDSVLEGFTLTGGSGNTDFLTPVGGGLYSFLSNPTVNRCVFTANDAVLGGGAYVISGSPIFAGCVFRDNTAEEGEGSGGAMYIFLSEVTIANCTFSNNSAQFGGGIFVEGGSTIVTNSILWGNSDSDPMGTVESAQVSVDNGSLSVTYCLVQGLGIFSEAEGNIADAPDFVDALGGNFRLSPGSPAIDAGNNLGAELLSVDLDGLPRRIDDGTVLDTGVGIPPIVDIGAFEAPGDCNTNGVPDETEPDGDGDGVIDGCDTCPETPSGESVALSGCPFVHNLTQDTQHGTIQAAIDAAINGDEIEVLPGTYHEAIDLGGRAIKLRSSNGPEATWIDAGSLGMTVITCATGEGPGTVIEGFTVTGGNASQGGGMVNDGASPTILRCTFRANTADFGGGMFNTGNAEPHVINCRFVDNVGSVSGGGMANIEANPVVLNCVYQENFGGFGGGGIYNRTASPSVTGSTFYGNIAGSFGGGILNDLDSFPTVTNCILWENVDSTGSKSSGQFRVLAGDPVLEFSCIQGGWTGAGGTGNLSVDPSFVDAVGGNLHLSVGSPCIDSGDNVAFVTASVLIGISVDYEGNARFVDHLKTPDSGRGVGLIMDMGAFEFQAPSGDFDRNGSVDLFDFAEFLAMFTGPAGS